MKKSACNYLVSLGKKTRLFAVQSFSMASARFQASLSALRKRYKGHCYLGVGGNEAGSGEGIHIRAPLLHSSVQLLGLIHLPMAGIHMQQGVVCCQHVPANAHTFTSMKEEEPESLC